MIETATVQSEIAEISLFQGDVVQALRRVKRGSVSLVVTSPPYNIGKIYERSQKRTLDEYRRWITPVARRIADKLKDGGHLCWQSGNHVDDGTIYPLDYIFFEIFRKAGLTLRNRIIWHFNFGLNATQRFSGRYETLLWFTKGDDYAFNLDPVRVPQRYPGKRHPKSHPKAGSPSGNARGKNPGDVWTFNAETAFMSNDLWEIPNVKANHVEKTIHPCQFPLELAERCVLALTKPGDVVLDPFVGTGTAVIAAAKNGRPAIGIDLYSEYLDIARSRYDDLVNGKLKVRPIGKPVLSPDGRQKVACIPVEWGGECVGQGQSSQGQTEAISGGESTDQSSSRPYQAGASNTQKSRIPALF